MCLYIAIEILSGNLSLGHDGSITCTSLIPVDVLEWINSNGDTVASQVDTNQLNLNFEPVNISIHNRPFTCQANKMGSVNKTTVIAVSGKIQQIGFTYQ